MEITRRDHAENDEIRQLLGHLWVKSGSHEGFQKVGVLDPGGPLIFFRKKFFWPRIRRELVELCRKTCIFTSGGGFNPLRCPRGNPPPKKKHDHMIVFFRGGFFGK